MQREIFEITIKIYGSFFPLPRTHTDTNTHTRSEGGSRVSPCTGMASKGINFASETTTLSVSSQPASKTHQGPTAWIVAKRMVTTKQSATWMYLDHAHSNQHQPLTLLLAPTHVHTSGPSSHYQWNVLIPSTPWLRETRTAIPLSPGLSLTQPATTRSLLYRLTAHQPKFQPSEGT